ncbi:uncharacterized protein BDR25DRAFT_257973 [Lindgomyces ingoldianus]|uniref:Uncharacterized protein n=1 Tax=Lindgomyces ingoldianus TaxID=673940 RepID=A0ACB6R353_9PLEO|nr:uncharacterized protein BDR25DRAFT_257973 [Lindgomyces ingoldianus]KAF2473492.1 hypothetical protein BDR25DRAFT_257973 [Lindgomyces ingoldianus]
MDTNTSSPLLRLPLEIRLIIYEYLLFPSAVPSSSHSTSVTNLLPNYHTYYSSDTNYDPFTLSVRTVDPYLTPQTSQGWRRRSTYHVRTGPFLTTTTPTTYRILFSPYTAHLRLTIPSLLSLNSQIHAEASKVLYSTYTFAFSTAIEAVIPFLSDLTPIARSAVRNLSITKKALPYAKEFDRAEWNAACGFLAKEMRMGLGLRHLMLNVVAGNPNTLTNPDVSDASDTPSTEAQVEEEADSVTPLSAQDFALLSRMRREWGTAYSLGVDLEWAEEVMAIRGLRKLSVKALVEHCPPPKSEGMKFWVAFSKSVERGFAEWVRGVMVEG